MTESPEKAAEVLSVALESAMEPKPVVRDPERVILWVILCSTTSILLGAIWAVLRTRNIQRLDGRYPTRWRAGRVWAYAPVWILLMTFTLVQLEPHPDLDVRPLGDEVPLGVVAGVVADLDVERATMTLLIGAVVWAYLGIMFEFMTETVAWERWEGTIEYTFMAPLSRAMHLAGAGFFAVLYGLIRAIIACASGRAPPQT